VLVRLYGCKLGCY